MFWVDFDQFWKNVGQCWPNVPNNLAPNMFRTFLHVPNVPNTNIVPVQHRTGPNRSGAVLACFWSDFQPKPSILDPIRVIFDDLSPNRHFGWDLDLQDQARDWLGGAGLTHTVFLTKKITSCCSMFSRGLATPHPAGTSCFFVLLIQGWGSDSRSAFLANPEIPIWELTPAE